mmetsp:Transcript_7411/g.16944  ORF Transcript_7411/g.16944 Transcript_7411/m.16944 type:complete len:234 (-) Transcript_7411:51-752(-)
MDSSSLRMLLGGGRPRERPDGADPNLRFYRNEIESEPHGELIDVIHRPRQDGGWDGDFDLLEEHHGYIQWLFPVFENAGMNFDSWPLSKEGAAAIRADTAASERVIRSYRLILRFFGLQLVDEQTGRLDRDPQVFRWQMDNLHSSAHNWLRVSRIITSLGELGFQRYKAPLLARLREEVDAGTLAKARRSLEEFWRPLVDEEDSREYAAKTLEVPEDREEGCLFKPGGRLAAP